MHPDSKKTTLGAEADLLCGFPFRSTEYTENPSDIRLLRGDNIVQGDIRWANAKRWPNEDAQNFQQYRLRKDDVVLAMDRPWIAAGLKYAAINEEDIPCLLLQRTARLRGGQYLDNGFLRYLIGSPEFTRHIQSITTGSLVPHISSKQIKDFAFWRPPLDTQRKVAGVLGALDAKIELNQRMNEELEGMAKLLYDYWFVQYDFPMSAAQAKALGKPHLTGHPYRGSGGPMTYHETLKREIPQGWEVSTIGETFRTHLGGTPSRKESAFWNPGEIAWLSSGEKEQLFVCAPDEKISREGLANSAATLLPEGAVILSIVRHIRASILGIDAATNQSVLGIRETEGFKHSFIYPFIVREIPRYMMLRTGAQQPHINKETVDTTSFVLPDQSVLKAYTAIAQPLFDQIKVLQTQTQELSTLRDWLLPMLMNGQVTVG